MISPGWETSWLDVGSERDVLGQLGDFLLTNCVGDDGKLCSCVFGDISRKIYTWLEKCLIESGKGEYIKIGQVI